MPSGVLDHLGDRTAELALVREDRRVLDRRDDLDVAVAIESETPEQLRQQDAADHT